MATRNENLKKINDEFKFLSGEVQYASRNTRGIVKIFCNQMKSFFDYALLIIEGRHKRYLAEENLEIINVTFK